MRILLIEDNLVDRMAFTRMMEKEGLDCTIDVADRIDQAKLLLNSYKYQLIVCDLNLPDGTAFDLSCYFAKNTIILLSGFADQELKEKAKHSNIFKLVAKRSDLKQFSTIIKIIKQKMGKKMIDNHPQQQQSNNDQFAPLLAHLKATFDNNPAYIADIIHSFLKENPKLIARLSLAAEIEDNQQIVKTAHQLKSGYMVMGLKDLENLAYELENNLPQKNEVLRDQIQTIIEQSHQSYLSLNAALMELDNSI